MIVAASCRTTSRHLGRPYATPLLSVQGLSRTPIDTQGFSSALRLMETTCADSFELFYGLFRYNPHSHSQLRKLRDSFAEVDRQVRVCVSVYVFCVCVLFYQRRQPKRGKSAPRIPNWWRFV